MILEKILFRLIIYLTLTVIIEAVAAFISGIRTVYGQAVVFLANVITNPLLNCILTIVSFFLSKSLYYYFLIPLEAAAVLTEGLIYKKSLSLKRNPFAVSLFLNVCSFFIGTAVLKLFS